MKVKLFDFRKAARDEVRKAVAEILPGTVEVIRCRDCKHYEWTENRVPEEQTWWCYKHNMEMGNNDYCSYGERKDDGDHHD